MAGRLAADTSCPYRLSLDDPTPRARSRRCINPISVLVNPPQSSPCAWTSCYHPLSLLPICLDNSQLRASHRGRGLYLPTPPAARLALPSPQLTFHSIHHGLSWIRSKAPLERDTMRLQPPDVPARRLVRRAPAEPIHLCADTAPPRLTATSTSSLTTSSPAAPSSLGESATS